MKKLRLALSLALLALARPALAQQQQSGLCAQVKMVILQQLTLERVGFQATLQVTDNDPNNPITGFAANLTFENPQLSTNGTPNDSSSMFFVQPPTLQNVTDIAGNGIIGPGQTVTVGWFIIPTVNAGGTNAGGIHYNIGATLSGQLNGAPIPASALLVIPANITVEPDAQLQITYFQPRDVIGVDPYTGLGSPVPFTFAALVQNVGYGPASSVIINSQQPKITSDVQHLPLVAELLGSRVNDSPLQNANLTVNLGNLQPGQAAKGAWDMITSLSGTFVSVSADYTHSTALGGQETSLIQSVNAYLFLHEVMDDQPGRDNVRDFLTDVSGKTDSIENLIPDTLYESQGGTFPVSLETNASVSGVSIVGPSGTATVNLNANFSGWGYVRVNDPGQATLGIGRVVRNDGKILNSNNVWTSLHYEPVTNKKDTYLNIFDYVGLGNYTYSITYTNGQGGTNLPVTSLIFAGPENFTNGAYYITPQTEVDFVAQSGLPVGIYDSVNGAPYNLALPLSFTVPGTYQLSYYASNSAGILENPHNVTLIVSGTTSLGFLSATGPSQPLYDPGAALSVRPTTAPITFQPTASPTALAGRIDIFQGVVGWATISNTPSSPTAGTSATLRIGGVNVDYYEYQLNGGAWSAEQPVSAPLALSGLAAGTNTVAVLGRSQYGAYLAPTNAATTEWVISATAPPTTITGAPASPTATNAAVLTVSGAGVTNYSYALNGGAFNVGAPVASPIVLANLNSSNTTVAVVGETNGAYQPTNDATSVSWIIDPLYGYDLSALAQVRAQVYTNLPGAPVTFDWDGTSDSGVIVPAGWYTARITLSDALGDTNFQVVLVQVGSLAGTNAVIANFNRGPQSPYARGRWAVWQDQSAGSWEIYAQDVTTNTPIVPLTASVLSQQSPRTDGRYVVWQAQQTNGNWDIYLTDLANNNGPQAVTTTAATDETLPSIDWPWVVYQARPTANTSAPWQVYAFNLLSNGPAMAISPTGQNELNPDVQAGRVVWQDLRNAGGGEIYSYDLNSGVLSRVTTNASVKAHPAVRDNWIAWEDNRNSQVDIYGYDLRRQKEIQLTATPANESLPYLDGPWLVCMEDSLGAQTGNSELVHLPSLITIPVTRTATQKTAPTLADGHAVWQETITNQSRITSVSLPVLQPVFDNENAVPITPAMISYAPNAYELLSAWASNGVASITEYTSLSPTIVTQTATLNNGAPSGVNFTLTPGAFLWIKFNNEQVLDLGVNNSGSVNLAAGANVFDYTSFPDNYRAFDLLQQIGLGNVQAVRMLDAEAGRWRVAEVQGGTAMGDNFIIPRAAVLMVSVANPVNNFVPQSP